MPKLERQTKEVFESRWLWGKRISKIDWSVKLVFWPSAVAEKHEITARAKTFGPSGVSRIHTRLG